MTDDDQIYPPRSTLRVRVCALIRGPHTPASTDQCSESLEHPELLEACTSPYQRTLITPSMSEQIHVHTSIHKAPLTHSVCPLSSTFLLPLFARIWLHTWDPPRHMYAHITGDINNFHSSREVHTRNPHVKRTVTPSLLRRYAHTLTKPFPRRAIVTHMPVQQRHSLYT